jgi:hypothetical protein
LGFERTGLFLDRLLRIVFFDKEGLRLFILMVVRKLCIRLGLIKDLRSGLKGNINEGMINYGR